MNELSLDGNHDIYLKDGHIARTASVKQSVTQSVLCMLKTEEGEAFSDSERGVPWLEKVCDLPISYLDVAQKLIKEKIESVDGVETVKSITLSSDGRNLSGKFSIVCGGSVATGEF